MGYDFGKRIREGVVKSALAKDREKITMSDIMYRYHGTITLTDFDMVEGVDMTTKEAKMYPVCVFAEDDGVYFNGGAALTRACQSWIEDFQGDITALKDELKSAGGIKLQFKAMRSMSGNQFFAVEVI